MQRFLRNLRKIRASTVIRNQVKNPKSPYSGALKTMLKLSQRSEILQSVQMLTKSIVKKVSGFKMIGKWVFWNPCFTTDCREVYLCMYLCIYVQTLWQSIVAYIQVSVDSKTFKIQPFRTISLEDNCLDYSLQYIRK